MRLLVVLFLAGCWHWPADYCRGCAIVDADRPATLRIPRGTHAVVVMVHGVFGFGDEWNPVVEELRRHPNVAYAVLAWRGPWRNPREAAHSLLAMIQSALDEAPPETTQVLIVAHSGGGLIASWAVRHARVPAGRHLSLAKVACPAIDLPIGFTYEREVDTPFGLAVGGKRDKQAPVPSGAEIAEYLDAHPGSARKLEGRAVYLGAGAGHNRILGRVAVPLIRAACDGAPPLMAHID